MLFVPPGPSAPSRSQRERRGPGALQGAEPAALRPPRLPGRLCPAGGGAGRDPGTGRRGLATTSGCFLDQEEKSGASTPERSLVITQRGQLEGN